jgi:signal peptidase I
VAVFQYPHDRSTRYLKRVVAVGGDTLEIRKNVLFVNGAALTQAALPDPCPGLEGRACTLAREDAGTRSYTVSWDEGPTENFGPAVVPPGHVFLMGDNRSNSHDSRRWGPAPLDHVEGTATFIYWSKDPEAGVRWKRIPRRVE